MSTKNPEEAIRANAQIIVDRFRSLSDLGIRFGYDRDSVTWVEGFIEQERSKPEATAESVAKIVQLLGSYLGECVINKYGGAWRQYDGSWGIFFDNANAVFPFRKVQKQFQNGLKGGDSILSFFDLIGPVIFEKSH
jgi:hypothetical protein